MARKLVIVKDMGLKRRLAQLAALSALAVEVGLPDGGEEVSDGLSLADVGAIHEYGTETIPARPWLSQGVAAAEPEQALRLAISEVATGRQPAERAAARMGLRVTSAIRSGIRAGIEPVNAPATIAKKGSSKPLVDTGRLLRAVTYRVVRTGQEEPT
jgi:phage gpG-like protein